MNIYPITVPGGSDTQVQYNNGGIFGGDSAFTFDDTNKIVDLSGKWTSGTQASPQDVTNTRQYGAEFHYSGNNYDVTGIRSRAQLVTTDTTATALGGLFQAANNDNINAGVLMGFMAEAIGKSTANASTISTMRGGLIGTEWGALDTVTNLKTLHVRGHSLNAAGAGSFGTGYGLYIENEAVGGNGQAYDAGIYFKGTNLSAGNKAYTYGIDFTGADYATAVMNWDANPKIYSGGTVLMNPNDASANAFIGYNSGSGISGTTLRNTCFGYEAGKNITNTGGSEGADNVYIGYQSGVGAGNKGYYNVGIGFRTFEDNTTGYSNVALGYAALANNTTGNANFGLGETALLTNTIGTSNVAIGYRALYSLAGDNSFNVAIGTSALDLSADSQYNIAIGRLAGYAITAGRRNVYIGSSAGRNMGTGYYNVGIGHEAMNSSGTPDSHGNVAIGYQSLYSLGTTAHYNTSIGFQGGYLHTTGDYSVYLGHKAGYNQTANSNLLIIDNQDRTNVAGELAKSLIYGVFAAAVADQSLRINANLILPKTSGMGIKVDSTTPTFGFADIIGDQFSKNTGATKPTLTAYNGAVDAWQFSDGDEAYMSFHIPHDYVPGTDIYLHVHWSQTSATATGGTVDFKYFAIYAKGWNQASGSTFTSTPITDSFSSIDINDGDSGLSQYQHHLTEIVISAATATAALFDRDDIEPDGIIELTLEMDTNSLTNSGAVLDPFIHYVDIHYQTTGVFGTKSREPDFYT